MQKLQLIIQFGTSFFSLICASCLAEEVKQIKEAERETVKAICWDQEEAVETLHEMRIDGQQMGYRARAGNLVLKDDKCQPKASLFFISYTKEGVDDVRQRPLTFCFNGGPGSSSVWLHLGVLGPKRVYLDDEGDAVPPYHLVENEFSLLDVTDLVFIDPVSTGYSQAIPPDNAKHFYGVKEDVKSVADFIRLYLTRFNRWESPKFIIGESYGTTRAASLAGLLHDDYFIYMNGIALISSALNFQTLDFSAGNDLAYLLALPSYTATAWYHKKLAPDLQANFLETVQAAREFVNHDYTLALFKGDLLSQDERQRVIQQLARFTGLSPEYIERSNLRIDTMHFAKELLRDQKQMVGRFDGRFRGIDLNAVGEYFEYDPSVEAVFGAFTATFNHYIQTDLKWKKDAPYKILVNLFPWNYGKDNQYLNVAEALRGVMTKNPYLRVFVGSGYYDLATPFFATEYTFNHLGISAALMKHVTMKHYEAGHMLYIYRPALAQLKRDLAEFYRQTLINQSEKERGAIEVGR
jgi:carboxypeptidase C (cathepsin A)